MVYQSLEHDISKVTEKSTRRVTSFNKATSLSLILSFYTIMYFAINFEVCSVFIPFLLV